MALGPLYVHWICIINQHKDKMHQQIHLFDVFYTPMFVHQTIELLFHAPHFIRVQMPN